MIKTISAESVCCKAAILWNVKNNNLKTGLCTKCKKWALVIEAN